MRHAAAGHDGVGVRALGVPASITTAMLAGKSLSRLSVDPPTCSARAVIVPGFVIDAVGAGFDTKMRVSLAEPFSVVVTVAVTVCDPFWVVASRPCP